jgi:membrane-associated phospholipid phosphatase
MGAFFYSLHFIAPTLFAFILWKYSPQNFRKYTAAFAIGTYSALVTFLVYPAAPPWQYVTGVQRILFSVDNRIGIPFYRTIFDFVSSDPLAAFPSLHAMFPTVVLLYSLKIKKLHALPVLIYPVGVWFSAVYLGEHYVVDILGGILYAVLAFILVEKVAPIIAKRIPSRPKPQ